MLANSPPWLHVVAPAICSIVILTSQVIAGNIIEVPSPSAPTIQVGIEIAEDGDTVLVAPGTYLESINFLGKTITVESVAGPERTTIDATGLKSSGVSIVSGEGSGTALRGFTITGGHGVSGSAMVGSGHNSWQLMIARDDAVLPLAHDGASSWYGGGVAILNSSALIDHCIIANNHLPLNTQGGGGGLVIVGPRNVSITNSVIKNNTAMLGGGMAVSLGTVTLTNTSFINNAADQGGGLNINNSAGVIATNCVFEDNSADLIGETTFFGGDAFVIPGALASFDSCEFRNNSSLDRGGGLSSSGIGTVLSNCLFEGNTASSGGGVEYTSPLTVSDCKFIDNIASGTSFVGGGGGIHTGQNVGSSPLILANSTFSGNSASGGTFPNSGGGGALLRGNIQVTNCTFENNMSETYGGGVQVLLAPNTTATVTESTFTNNHATQTGGGMLAHSTFVAAKISISDSHFVSNSTDESGGGLARTGDDAGTTIVNCTFVDNIAKTSSGGLLLSINSDEFSPRAQVLLCSFAGNEALSMAGAAHIRSTGGSGHARADFIECHFESNDAPFGGAVLVNQTGNPFIPWPPPQFENCTFTVNTAMQGGAIDINVGGSAVIKNSTFEANAAETTGGAVSVLMFANIYDSQFILNHAERGGAIGMHGSFPTEIINCTFDANTAKTDGGAIVGTQNYTAMNSKFTANVAGEYGGAIATSGSPLIDNSTLVGNVAGISGGAIHSSSSPGAQLQAILACDNSPEHIYGPYTDLGDNELLEECPKPHVPGDLNGDGVVDVTDLLILLSAWGDCREDCPADLNADGVVDVVDMLILLANWG